MTLAGDNGVLTKATQAKVTNEHAKVYEGLKVEAHNYIIEKEIENPSITLIDHLKNQNIIIANNVVDVKALLGQKLTTGNGTFETGDVYVLEELVETAKLASTNPIKIAEVENNGNKEYNLIYYAPKDKTPTEIGKLNDISVGKTESGGNDDVDVDEWKWITNPDGTLTITKYLGSNEKVVIPSEINGTPVTAVGKT